MKRYIYIILVAVGFIISGCGEGSVQIEDAEFQPKIVIDGYLYAGKTPENIKITRNFPLNHNIDITQVILFTAKVVLTDISANKNYDLVFDPQTFSFKYPGYDFLIESGKEYKLTVNAVVDGKELQASATTKVPLPGMKALTKDLGSYVYGRRDENGKNIIPEFTFTPSAECDFYVFSIRAQDATMENFIYDNDFIDVDSEDVAKHFDNFKFQYQWIQNVNPNVPELKAGAELYSTWFYGKYEVIIYAADKNFNHFLMTHQSVQELDGNFHEPVFYIDGDGIGVFGSAVVDTIKFELLRP